MKKLIVSLFVLMGFHVVGQNQWTLEQCVEYAFENNLQIKQSTLAIDQARVERNAAKANAAPNLNFNTGYFWQFGSSIDPVTNTRTLGGTNAQTNSSTLSANWTIFGGLDNYNAIKQTKLDYLVATYNLEDMRNDVAINIAGQYLQVLFNKEVVNINTLVLENSEKLYLQTKKRYEAGAVAKGDLLQIEAQKASDEQALVAAENNLNLSVLQLAQTLQLDTIADFDIVAPELELPDSYLMAMSPDDIYYQAIDLQPGVKSAEYNVLSSEYAVSRSKAGYMPRLTLSAQLNSNFSTRAPDFSQDNVTATNPSVIGQVPNPVDPTNPILVYDFGGFDLIDDSRYPAFGTQYENNFNQFIGFNLQVPIFNNLNVKRNVSNSKLQLENSKVAYEQAKMDFRQTVQRAHSDALASYKSYQSAVKSVESNKESFEYAEKRRQEGAINQYEYDNARILYLNAISQQLQSKYDYIFKIKVLEFYLSNKLSLD
ncbi:MAG: TolC family protein [Schleiferiaceae bacterium]|jgi:outer membrane protein|nr:TolC family protein [Schleiferiaceae bacterium]